MTIPRDTRGVNGDTDAGSRGKRTERQEQAIAEIIAAQDRAEAAAASTQSERALPKAGWYPHPSMVATRRYWDGAAWTDHIAPDGPSASAGTKATPSSNTNATLIGFGYVLAIIFPLAGFIIGCVLLTRRPGHGVVLMLLSMASFLVWYDYLTQPVVFTDVNTQVP